jgi:hypothetical protein
VNQKSGIFSLLVSIRPEIILFIISLGVSAFFIQWEGWNQASRQDLVRAIVENQTFIIDEYHENTGDKALRNDHYYSDKAPGASWLAVLPYSIAYYFVDDEGSFLSKYGLYISNIFAVSIPSAISVSSIFILFRMMMLPMGISIGLALAYALGTLTLPYSTMLFGHQLSAALLIISFVLIFHIKHHGSRSPKQIFAIGFLLGYAFVSDYTSVFAIIALFIYGGIILRWSWEDSRWSFAGLGIPAIMLMSYNWIAFGGVLSFSYHFSVFSDIHHQFFQGLVLPRPEIFFIILFSGYRGLFFLSPWLLLAMPGISIMLKRKDYRLEGVLCLFVFITYVLFNSSYWKWDGGWAFGPRFLILSIPFLVVAVGALWLPQGKNIPKSIIYGNQTVKKRIFIITAIYSGLMMLLGTAVNPMPSESIFDPLNFLLQGFFDEKFVHNMGIVMGLNGWIAFIPLFIFLAGTCWWLLKSSRAS